MAIAYEFSRINPLCTSDSDGSNEKTTMVEFTLKGSETVNGVTYEAYANHEITLSGDASVAPASLDLDTLLNGYISDNNIKAAIWFSFIPWQYSIYFINIFFRFF